MVLDAKVIETEGLELTEYMECLPVVKNAKLDLSADSILVHYDIFDHIFKIDHYKNTVSLLEDFIRVAKQITDKDLMTTTFTLNYGTKKEWICKVLATTYNGKNTLVFVENK